MPRLVIFHLIIGIAALSAQEARIAVVDMAAVFRAHPETAKAEAALERKRRDARKTFDAKATELKNLLEKHQTLTTRLIEAGEKATEQQKTEAREMLERAGDLERQVASIQTTQERDLTEAFVEERRRILESIVSAIRDHNSGKYAMVLDRSASSANGIPQVIDAPGAEDITSEILKLVKAAR